LRESRSGFAKQMAGFDRVSIARWPFSVRPVRAGNCHSHRNSRTLKSSGHISNGIANAVHVSPKVGHDSPMAFPKVPGQGGWTGSPHHCLYSFHVGPQACVLQARLSVAEPEHEPVQERLSLLEPEQLSEQLLLVAGLLPPQ